MWRASANRAVAKSLKKRTSPCISRERHGDAAKPVIVAIAWEFAFVGKEKEVQNVVAITLNCRTLKLST